jgi:hypothetical protein
MSRCIQVSIPKELPKSNLNNPAEPKYWRIPQITVGAGSQDEHSKDQPSSSKNSGQPDKPDQPMDESDNSSKWADNLGDTGGIYYPFFSLFRLVSNLLSPFFRR